MNVNNYKEFFTGDMHYSIIMLKLARDTSHRICIYLIEKTGPSGVGERGKGKK
jgi:uncharacterized protein YukJ